MGRKVASFSRKQASNRTLAPQQVRSFSLLGTGVFQAHKTSPAAIVISASQPAAAAESGHEQHSSPRRGDFRIERKGGGPQLTGES